MRTSPALPIELTNSKDTANRPIIAVFEFCMTVVASWVIYLISSPLQHPKIAAGLGNRYGEPSSSHGIEEFFDYLTRSPWLNTTPHLRASMLLEYSGYWLLIVATLGWLGLTFTRTSKPNAHGLVLSIWCSMGWFVRPLGLCGGIWLAGTVLGILLAISSSLTHWPKFGITRTGAYRSFWSAWIWPGWIFFSAIGWLWIGDFSARGPISPLEEEMRPGARYFGLRQADGLWLANGILLCSALYRDWIITSVARISSALQRIWTQPQGKFFLSLVGCSIALLLGVIGHNANNSLSVGVVNLKGLGKPHISGEILRLIGLVSIAWFIYRNGEWGAPVRRIFAGAKGLILVLMLCAVGLIISSDMGPLLVLFMVSLLLIAIPVLNSRRKPSTTKRFLTITGGCLLAVLGISAWKMALTEVAPVFSSTAAEREFARQLPFSASSPNLAQVNWLIDAAPFISGFGLARVPYCGAAATIGISSCTLGSGAPIQLPSDFAFAGIAATWGMLGGGLLVLGLIIWLSILPTSSLATFQQVDNRPAWYLLHTWLIALACIAAQAQSIISAGGTLTWSPLSGVTLPLLGYGTVSLCMCALWIGLAANPPGSVISR